jgi:hypothetical protein
VGQGARIENTRSANRILVRKPERKIKLGRPRHGRDDNIKMDPKEVGWGSMERIELAQNRDKWRSLLNAVLNIRVL